MINVPHLPPSVFFFLLSTFTLIFLEKSVRCDYDYMSLLK